MKHENGHTTEIVTGSTKRSAVGGVEWVVNCCGQHESSGHIQNPGLYSTDELRRLREDHQHQVAKEHASHMAATQFLSDNEQDVMECAHCK